MIPTAPIGLKWDENEHHKSSKISQSNVAWRMAQERYLGVLSCMK